LVADARRAGGLAENCQNRGELDAVEAALSSATVFRARDWKAVSSARVRLDAHRLDIRRP